MADLTPPRGYTLDVPGPPPGYTLDVPDAGGDVQSKGILDNVKDYFANTSLFHPAAAAAAMTPSILPGGQLHPIDALQNWIAQNQTLGEKALNSFKTGNILDGFRHFASYVANTMPGVGTKLDGAGDKAATGDYGGAISDTASLTTDLLAGAKAPAVLDAATNPGAGAAIARVPSNAVHAVAGFAKSPGGGDIMSGATQLPTGIALAAGGNPIWGMGMAARGSVQLMKGFADRWQAATDAGNAAAADAVLAEAQRYSRSLVGQPTEPIWRNNPTPTPQAPQEFTPASTTLPSGRTVGGIQNQTAAPTASVAGPAAMPPGVDPKTWAQLPEPMRQALRAKLGLGTAATVAPAPAAYAPRPPEYYGAAPTPSVVHPDPAVRATPSAPPAVGPAAPTQHPVYGMPRTALDSDVVQAVQYHPESQTAVLHVRNRAGEVVPYKLPMTPEMHQRILAASADPAGSVGKIWNQEIRPAVRTVGGELAPAKTPPLPSGTDPAVAAAWAEALRRIKDQKP